jgi:hypothetical protein
MGALVLRAFVGAFGGCVGAGACGHLMGRVPWWVLLVGTLMGA